MLVYGSRNHDDKRNDDDDDLRKVNDVNFSFLQKWGKK